MNNNGEMQKNASDLEGNKTANEDKKRRKVIFYHLRMGAFTL
ncbi:hypothetical protein bcere0026_8080 [Bacillus mycoides]|uniref:Uncharacterized protein n=1 Tax=Bacillus mycoides TaxID=1405 RepID=C2XQ55_BACMY|nr:hypothetical protein bcere0026_8080 [Bacillus mycoides]